MRAAYNRKELTGRKYGRLVVLGYVDTWHKRARWLCRCECGGRVVVQGNALLNGNTQSDGCLQRERAAAYYTKHGAASRKLAKGTREYIAWENAKRRCFYPKVKQWEDYGGRGITMCPEWKNDFSVFLNHMGLCPPGLTLDRINNDGNYEPGNVRWATRSQQVKNQRKRKKKSH